ncbi:hypothetical protein HQ585_21020 [candidate division KSB1 bacterium]|nr:hypothetical protein [candidate division KSB1 bacterium]
MFYRLKIKDWLYLLALVVLTYLWINYDQLIFAESGQRMIAFPILGLALMILFFFLVNPEKPLMLSNTMTVILIPLFIFLSLFLHVFLFKDGFQNKSIILWFMTAGMIYLSGWLYGLIRRG